MSNSPTRPNQSFGLEALRKIAQTGIYYKSQRGDAFVDITVAGIRRSFPVESRQFTDWIRAEAYNNDVIPSSSNLRELSDAMIAKVSFGETQCYPVWRRVAELDGFIYIDLCNSKYEVVKVGPHGWSIINNPPVRFQRFDGMQELPIPIRGGSIGEFTSLLNLSHDQDAAVVTAFCVHCLQPKGPYPLLVLNGPNGSSKSTLSKVLVGLIDPNSDPLKQFPRNEHDLALALDQRHLVAFDNVSNLTQARSDMLARISTGGSFGVRKLYSDKDQIKIELENPLILNGIPNFVERPDLADRCLFIELNTIAPDKRITAEEYGKKFYDAHPKIFGVLLDGVSTMLAHKEWTTLDELDRMADFHLNAVASETAFWPSGTYNGARLASKKRWQNAQLSKTPMAKALINLVSQPRSERDDWTGRTVWTGSVVDLFDNLRRWYDEDELLNFPKTTEQLGIIIKKIKPILEENGVSFKRTKENDYNRSRGYEIYLL